jgi:CHAD domain-containing protein
MAALSWKATLAAALRRQWKRYQRALERCQRCFTEKAVHDSRVESRRLIAQIEILGALAPGRHLKRARRILKQHLDCLEDLRDTQVQLLLVQQVPDAASAAELLRDALRRREKRCLRRAIRDLHRFKMGRLKKGVSALIRQFKPEGAGVDRQLRDHKALLRAADASFARVVERRRQMDAGHVATLHRTRVAFKKFRYMVEGLQPILPRISQTRQKAMRSFQDLFGDLQDTDVFLQWLEKLFRKQPAHAASLAPFRLWLLKRRTEQIQRCLDHADVIQDFWPIQSLPRKRMPARERPVDRKV